MELADDSLVAGLGLQVGSPLAHQLCGHEGMLHRHLLGSGVLTCWLKPVMCTKSLHQPRRHTGQQDGDQHVGGSDKTGLVTLADGQLHAERTGKPPDRQGHQGRRGYDARTLSA
jgi:hypothetical protein